MTFSPAHRQLVERVIGLADLNRITEAEAEAIRALLADYDVVNTMLSDAHKDFNTVCNQHDALAAEVASLKSSLGDLNETVSCDHVRQGDHVITRLFMCHACIEAIKQWYRAYDAASQLKGGRG